jgi:hypothetical protein
MADDTQPQDTWQTAAPTAAAAAVPAPAAAAPAPTAAPPKPKRRPRPRPEAAPGGTGSLNREDEALAVSKDIALAIDGINDQLHGIQRHLVKRMSHITVDAQAWTVGFGQLFRKLFATPLLVIMQVALVPLRFVQGLLGRVAPEPVAADDDEEGVDWDAEMEGEAEAPVKLADFNDLLDKNIIFLDNTKRPIFSAQKAGVGGKFGKVMQDLYMELCLNAIRECAPLTNGMPPVDKGRHAGKVLEDLMAEVAADDVWRFFTFSCKFAASYSGKNFRISETYATWLMNGAPLE